MLELIKSMVEADVPVLLWGAPGTGKTATIQHWAEENNVHLEVLIGSQIDPTDLGRPIVTDNDDVILAPPPWAKRIRAALDAKQACVLMLDELNSAPPSVQAALLRVVNERKVAELDISGCRMLSAANPMGQATDATDLSHATANRWAHLDWTVDAEEWAAGELAGWGKPDKKLAPIRALITGWVLTRPDSLLDPPPDDADSVKGWPSPRSWSHVAKVIGGLGVEGLTTKAGRVLTKSLIGAGMATEFIAWVADQDIPTAQELLSGAKQLPTRGDRSMLAMSSAIAHAVSNGQMPALWSLCAKQRDDLAIMSAKRSMRTAKIAGIDPAMTKDMKKLIQLVKKFS